MKDTIETVRQRNSSEAAQQNFMKLCSYEAHRCRCAYPKGNSDSIFSKHLKKEG